MKASIKFREAQKPLFRAKVPLNFLGFPFRSGIVAGESKELALNLATSFESGPSLKVAYRPNDFDNPFSVVFKTGTRHLRSPISRSFNMRAEFNLIGGVQNPSFYVHFKPDLGDFIINKVQYAPMIVRLCKKFSNTPLESPDPGLVKGVLSDLEMTVTVNIPLRKIATLNFRWAVSLPATEDSSMVLIKMNNPMSGISFRKLPCLILNKIGVDYKVGPSPINGADFLRVKKLLESIQAENGALKKAMDNLKGEFLNRLEITRAENGTSKEAIDYLYREFITHRVLRMLNVRYSQLVG